MSHTIVQDHQNNCCVKHGCRYGDFDCPVYYGDVKKIGICYGCEKLSNEHLCYEINDGQTQFFFDNITQYRAYLTKVKNGTIGFYNKKQRVDLQKAIVTEHIMRPARKVSLERAVVENEIYKRWKK